MVDVSVVIPAYRENRLEDTVEGVSEALRDSDLEILVVTDHPEDPTTGKAEDLAGGDVRHLSLERALGKGGSVVKGLAEARGDVVGFVDADGSVEPSDVPKLVETAYAAGAAVASRRVEGSVVQADRSLARRWASRAFNLFVRHLFSLDFLDTQCGAKFFREEVLSPVLPEMASRGFEFDVELLWRLKRRGVEVEEVPVKWSHSDSSTFSLTEGPSMILSLISLRLRERLT